MKKYKLYNRNLKKQYYARYDYIKIYKLDIDFNVTNIVIESNYEIDIEKRIVNFVNKMKEISRKEDLKLLINNLTDITVNVNKFNVNKLKHIYGFYNVKNNEVNVVKNNYIKTINHELLHMSSSYYDKQEDITYSGFSQTNGKTYIGLGITKGYTQYLAEKHFDESFNYAYVYEKQVASVVESIIGDDKMLSLYLNANLYGLIEELAKYSSMNEAYRFIMNMDFITNNMDNSKILNSSKEYIMNVLKEINIFLLKITANKYYSIKNEQDQDKYLENILIKIPDKLIINKNKYNITNEDDAINIFKDAYKKNNTKIKKK